MATRRQAANLPTPPSHADGVELAHAPSAQPVPQKRGDSVSEQFGMITPPDATHAELDPMEPWPPGASKASKASVKSESARKAANKRHAKEKARKMSFEAAPEDEEEDGRKEQYREKNKIAAAKCRNKKRRYNDEIETQARELEGRNKALKAELMDLRNVVIMDTGRRKRP